MGHRSKKPETRQARWHRLHPWARFVSWAKRRCKDVDSKWFQFYGAKGITCDLTAADTEFLWKRDNAAAMQKPSLDRYPNTAGNYTRDNCRFVEFKVNSRLAWDESFRFLYNGDDDDGPEQDAAAAAELETADEP